MVVILSLFLNFWGGSCPYYDVAVIATAVQLLHIAVVTTAVDRVKVAPQCTQLLACEHVQTLYDAS